MEININALDALENSIQEHLHRNNYGYLDGLIKVIPQIIQRAKVNAGPSDMEEVEVEKDVKDKFVHDLQQNIPFLRAILDDLEDVWTNIAKK